MEDKEVKLETVSVDDVNVNTESQPETKVLEPKIAELTATVADLNDKYLRTAAELENTRRRAAIDSETRARARAMAIAEKILPIADAVDAALKHNPDDTGMQSLAMALKSAFDSIGITRMETLGVPLDPTKHSAIQVVSVDDDTKPNTIVEEMQPGYMFGDNVLRTAMVVVAK